MRLSALRLRPDCDVDVLIAQSRNGTLLLARISLRPANCLAKINHAGCGAALLKSSHMYRSSLTLAFVALCSATAAASDLSSVYVAPGGIYAPSADVYVRPAPAYRQPPYAEGGYGYRQPSYGTPGPAYRAPAAVYGEYGPAYAAAAGLCRTRAGLSGALLRPGASLRSVVTTVRIATTRGSATMRWNTRRGRPCPCPTVRARDATTAMAGGSPAINHRCHCDDSGRAD